MPSDDLKPAIAAALRVHEIGNASPYQISFAGKGNSGASFGFMQGDLAAGQPIAEETFRGAMAAAGMSAAKVNSLLAQLSQLLISNPLSAADTAEVNAALRASSGLVDKMDQALLSSVYSDLDRCEQVAEGSGRKIEPKALIYMALWINMSGPPTKLLTWLQGGNPALVHPIAGAGSVVTGVAMEDYLAATDYYTQNPRNLAHAKECAAAGMRVLQPHDAAATAAFGNTAAGSLSAVTFGARSSSGAQYTVSIRKTGASTGIIELTEGAPGQGSTSAYNVQSVQVASDGSKLVCRAQGFPAKITCSLIPGTNNGPSSIRIEVTDTPLGLGNSVNTYSLDAAAFAKLKQFLQTAAFPAIGAQSRGLQMQALADAIGKLQSSVNAIDGLVTPRVDAVTDVGGDIGIAELPDVEAPLAHEADAVQQSVWSELEPPAAAATGAQSRSDLAALILRNTNVKLATAHPTTPPDGATAHENIDDTAAGRPARRSHIGGAPGGTVELDIRLLKGVLALAVRYSFTIAEIAGGVHNPNSRHYAGLAADVGIINGRPVDARHPDVPAFRAMCRELGATEVLGPGDPGHSNHVHAGWPRQ